jgi:hypothetical protein
LENFDPSVKNKNVVTNKDIELSKFSQTENAKNIVFTTEQCKKEKCCNNFGVFSSGSQPLF